MINLGINDPTSGKRGIIRVTEGRNRPNRTRPLLRLLSPQRLACQCAILLLLATACSKSLESPSHASPTPSSSKVLKVLVLRVSFPSVVPKGLRRKLTNDENTGLVDRLTAYIGEASLGRVEFLSTVSQKTYFLKNRRPSYISAPRRLVEEAFDLAYQPAPAGERALIDALEPDILIVFFAGPGAESDMEHKYRQSLPWSNALPGTGPRLANGHKISGSVVVSEDPLSKLKPFGVLCHEIGHLFGWPELYAPNQNHEGIGVWGLMGQGSWVGRGAYPPHPSAYAKLKSGWVDPRLVETSQTVELEAVQIGGEVIKIYTRGPEFPEEYFLIENRQRIGYDRGLRGDGLLIWHVDEKQRSFRRSQDIAHHKRVDLLTADSWPSHLDIGVRNGGNRGDAGDPWQDRRVGPGPNTKPHTGSYDGTPGRFRIRNISPSGNRMTFDIDFLPLTPRHNDD